MSEDKELVDAWICEFWGLVERSPDSIKNSEFNQIRLEGFLMAKRSQPVIELPKQFKINNGDDNDETQLYFCADDVEQAITAAGYQYRIKE